MPMRDPTPEELKQLIDSGDIPNDQGVGFMARLLAKNLSASPQQAADYLRRIGYEVKPVADESKMQFLVRKQGDTKWGVLDPQGFDWQDITDIASELISGSAVGSMIAGGAAGGALLGAPSGPQGAIAGGILGGLAGGQIGGAGTESARQALGGLAGVNVTTNEEEISRQGKAGLLAYPTGAVINKVGGTIAKGGLRALRRVSKTGANIARNMLGRGAGVSEEEFLAATRTPEVAKAIVRESAPRTGQVLDKIREFTQSARIPEYEKAKALLPKARPVKLGGMFKILENRGAKGIGDEKAGIDAARQIAIDIANVIGVKPNEIVVNAKGGQRIEQDIWSALANVRVPATVAEEIKQRLQKQIDFSGKPGQDLLNDALTRAQRSIRMQTIAAMPTSELRSQYSNLMERTSSKMDILKRVDKRIGEWKAPNAGEGVLRNLFREGKTEDRKLFQALDKQFGQKFMEEIQLSGVAGKFSKDAPRLMATGGFLGVPTGSAVGTAIGAGIGGAAGGFPGAVVGSAAGFAAGSPKTLLKGGRAVNVTENAIRNFVNRAGQEVTRAEPLAEKAGYGAASLATGAGRPVNAAPEFSIDVQGSDEDVARAKSLVDQLNQSGLSPEQKFQRFKELFSQQPAASTQ